MGRVLSEYTPHILMTLYFISLAIFIVFLQEQISNGGFSPLVFVFYEHLLSTLLLSILAVFLEWGKRPKLTLTTFSWAFLIGFLQLGIHTPHELSDFALRAIGFLMVLGAVVAGASGSLLVELVVIKYPSDISLSAMMCFSGTIQTAIIAGITERNISKWKLHSVSEILVILYGGVTVTGLGYYVQTWCINKRGPVFTSAFSPLLVVFSFVLETLILKEDAFLGSILGAVFVVVGLYMLLWAKADDHKEKLFTISSSEGQYEQLA